MINRADKHRLQKIINFCSLILGATIDNGLNHNEMIKKLSDDTIFQTSISMMLVQIGELTRRLSDELKYDHSDIPWKTIYGLRNRLVHDYEETNWIIITGVIEDDIRPLNDFCVELLNNESS